MIEKKLIQHVYVPSVQIEYIKDYRKRLFEFFYCFNEYSLRKYSKKILDELEKIDSCIEKYYKGMEETFFSMVVNDFEVQQISNERPIKVIESKVNKKTKNKRKK